MKPATSQPVATPLARVLTGVFLFIFLLAVFNFLGHALTPNPGCTTVTTSGEYNSTTTYCTSPR